MYGSIEFGGTKIRCAVFDKDGEILETTWVDTTNPKDNMEKIVEFYQKNPVEKLGVGAFGPIDLNEKSKNYGLIENTPKEKWQGFDLLGNLKKNVCQNVGLVTDVGLSLIGEDMKGASQDLKSSIYLTVGTGIGGAYIQNGKLLNGYSHPEMGHVSIKRNEDDDFKSTCTYHDDCLEGLACGPSVKKRLGKNPKEASLNEKSFKIAANYIAQGILTYSLVLRPEIVIIGGGLINKDGFIELIREEFDKIKTGYIDIIKTSDYIVKPKLGNDSALVGGYYLAKSL